MSAKNKVQYSKRDFYDKVQKEESSMWREKKYRITRLTTYTFFFTLKSQDNKNYIS